MNIRNRQHMAALRQCGAQCLLSSSGTFGGTLVAERDSSLNFRVIAGAALLRQSHGERSDVA